MGIKNFIKKSISFVSAAAMALTMVAMPVGSSSSYAAEGTEDNLHLSKGIELQSDGNYKITLEAYSTGKDTTTTTEKPVPLDIVLVLDQSGSMKESFTSSETYIKQSSKGYTYTEDSNKEYYYRDGEKYYKVKIDYEYSKYSNKKYYMYYQKDGTTYYFYKNTIITKKEGVSSRYATIWTGTLYTRQVTTTTRLDALKSAVTSFVGQVQQNATLTGANHRISMVGFASDKSRQTYKNTEILTVQKDSPINYKKSTETTQDFETALNNSLMDVKTQSSKIDQAINFLDADGDTYSEYGLDMAYRILQKHPVKNGENRKQIVVMFTDGYTAPYGTDNINYYMSDRAIANSKLSKDLGATVYTIGIFDGANPSMDLNNGYEYESTDESKQLVAANRYMNLTSSNYPSAISMNNTGDSNTEQGYYKAASNASELKNVFTSITQSETTSTTSVELKSNSILRDVISNNFELPKGAEASSVKVYTADSDKVSNDGISWKDREPDTTNQYKVSIKDKKVDVTGFDYSQNYVTANHSGKKLIVEILVNGLQSGIDMDSNDTEQAKSGIYKNSTETTSVKNFVSPKVTIPEYSYVLDYGKKVTIPNTDTDLKKAYSETTQINSTKAAPTKDKSIKKTYGTFALENNAVTYQPERINWDGFDSIFSFSKKTGDGYEWSKTNVIPATSVYYEDDFGETTNTDSDVSIVWGGTWTPDKGSEPGNQNQTSTNSRYGWDTSYEGKIGYSNGSATKTNQQGATATFTFTGTGVDVYSRTNGNVGLICAELYSGKGAFKEDGKTYKPTLKTQYIDNISTSGDYYQIPTLSFDNLDYGTYTVVITAGYQGQGTSGTYYLDGIRVYNPLKENDTAEKAYDVAGEANAKYIKLRDTLLKNGFGTTDEPREGTVFIDDISGQSVTVGTEEQYKKYGPKNEVYLAKNQAVAFKIDGYQSAKNNVFVGLKALNNDKETTPAITATITNGDSEKIPVQVNSSSDLYYQITPTSSGEVVIKNNSDNILSITKLRITNAKGVSSTNNEVKLMATPSLLSYAAKFDSLSETKVEEDKNTNLDEDDVTIDNPSDNDNKDNNNQETSNSIWNNILNSIKHWFRK